MTHYSFKSFIYALAIRQTLASRKLDARKLDDGLTDAWSYLPIDIPIPLSDMSIAVLSHVKDDSGQKRIVITGGCDSPEGNEYKTPGNYFECGSISNKVFSFTPTVPNTSFQAWTGEFTSLKDMPRVRNRHASAVVNGQLCVFGGRDETDTLIDEVDCYDPSSDEWSTPFNLPEGRKSSDFTAFTEGSAVYLVGGYNQTYIAFDTVTIVDMTDPTSVTFSDGKKLRETRGDIDVAALPDGSVYVSGGFTHENTYEAPRNTVERYDPASGIWSSINSLNDERGDKQLVALNGKVYAIGGEAKVDMTGVPEDEIPDLGALSTVLDSVEVLDPNEDVHGGMAEWRSLGGMPQPLFRFGASEWEGDIEGDDDGFIFVFGGQVGYDADCECFRTTDKVMVFDVKMASAVVETPGEESTQPSSAVSFAEVNSVVLSILVAGVMLTAV